MKARLGGMLLLSCLILVGGVAQAQGGSCLDAADEPHHRVILDRPDVRILVLELARLESTKMHCHNSAMLYVVPGVTRTTTTMEGTVGVSHDWFAGEARFVYWPLTHSTRNETSGTYKEVVVETRRPVQYIPLNDYYAGDEFPGVPEGIGPTWTVSFTRGAMAASKSQLASGASVPLRSLDHLLIALTDLDLEMGDASIDLKAQEVMLLPAGAGTLKNPGRLPARFVVIEF
jgi:hypothetical protein